MSDNAAQIEFWNGQAGQTWVRAQEKMDAMLADLTTATIDRAAPKTAERVIDVGCGCGGTSIELAARGAAVWGIDISEPMLARAEQRASGLPEVHFTRTDAASAAFEPEHDLVFSRFGVMFFANPAAAFANLRTSLRPDGRLVFLCWRAAAENPWIAVAGRAVQPFLPAPETPPDPRAPGPFAFAEKDYLVEILRTAGYRNFAVEPLNGELSLGGTLDEALTFQGEIGPLSRVLAELDDEVKPIALQAAREALMPYAHADGIRLAAACWLVHADAG